MILHLQLNDDNVIVSTVRLQETTSDFFPEGTKYIAADIEYQEDMMDAIFTKGKKKSGAVEYVSIEYVPQPTQGPELWKVINGEWVDVRDDETKMDYLKTLRNNQLSQSDWTQGNDSPLSQEKKDAWALWRNALRNLPTDFPTPVECQAELDRLVANKPK